MVTARATGYRYAGTAKGTARTACVTSIPPSQPPVTPTALACIHSPRTGNSRTGESNPFAISEPYQTPPYTAHSMVRAGRWASTQSSCYRVLQCIPYFVPQRPSSRRTRTLFVTLGAFVLSSQLLEGRWLRHLWSLPRMPACQGCQPAHQHLQPVTQQAPSKQARQPAASGHARTNMR